MGVREVGVLELRGGGGGGVEGADDDDPRLCDLSRTLLKLELRELDGGYFILLRYSNKETYQNRK